MHKKKTTYRNLIEYLKGKLSNKERYRVEKDALEDPFLQDALDGFETIDVSTLESDIAVLSQKVNQQATTTKTSSYYFYPIAASLVLLIGLSFWWFSNRRIITDTQIVQEDVKEEILYKELDSVLSTPTEIVFNEVEKEVPAPSRSVSKPTNLPKEIAVKKKKIEEVVFEEVEASTEEILEDNVVIEETIDIDEPIVDVEEPVTQSQSVVVATDDIIKKETVVPNIATTTSLSDTEVFSRKAKKIEKELEVINVVGKVTAQGKPLADVAVIVKGEMDKITETDSNGNYRMTTTKGSTLSFFFIGYERKEILVENSSTIDVELSEEMVEALLQAGQVTYDADGRESLEQKDAIPFNETQEAFKKWVKEEMNTRYSDIVLDKNVTVQIDVNEYGEITEVVLLSNLSKQAQKALKRIIKSSPDWTPARLIEDEEDIPSRVILTIGFGA